MDERTIITPCPDGPLLVRGDFTVLTGTAAGTGPTNGAAPAEGSTHRRTVALCRCGVSTIKPFCDGTHKLVRFRTEDPSPGGSASA